ncbi:hypothetical protein [Neisseria meningitidis]|uniref:hypothetical protein n=1 Tax=Neisseria meningitidis TaxID=487 RepID=UPI0005DB076C|nr:hypothetical protein [Neisseria meningitidis]CKJ92842.1 putative cytochrome B561 [Neisseria meningitidis]
MNTNQPAVYDPLTRTLHWLTVAGFIGIPTTIVLWTIYSGLTKIRTGDEAADSTNRATPYWFLLIHDKKRRNGWAACSACTNLSVSLR